MSIPAAATQLLRCVDRRAWLLMLVSLLVALVAAWLALCAPRNLAHMPVHERIAKHAVIIVFGHLMHSIEILSDHFGFNYFSVTRSILHTVVLQGPQHPEIQIENHYFDGVRVRMYIPNNRSTNSPAVLYIHGGGWVYFHTEHYDGPSQKFALELRAVVVSVEFRRPPEHGYPAPLDDCFRALRHFMRHAALWNVDPTRIAVAGDSAGGHLAAALVLRWRREVVSTLRSSKPVPLNSSSAQPTLHPIRLQVLIYPSLQFVNSTLVSLRALPDPLHRWTSFCRVWTWLTFPERIGEKALAATLCAGNHTTRATRQRLAHYFHFGPPDGSEDQVDAIVTHEDRAVAARVRASVEHPEGDSEMEAALLPRLLDPEVSPLLVDSFEDLPPTYVVTCGFDSLRDEGLLYVRRLRRSGRVQVAHKHYPLHMHGFMGFVRTNELQRDLAVFLDAHPEFL